MDNSETFNRTEKQSTIANDDSYYKYIFKRTEKIISSVFYVLSDYKDNQYFGELIKDVMRSAEGVLDQVLMSLESTRENCGPQVLKVAYGLMGLESKLRLLYAAKLLPNDLLLVFVAEIDSVLRSIKNYDHTAPNPLFEGEDSETGEYRRRGRRVRPAIATGGAQRSALQGAGQPDRKTRILAILREKGQASIKDISDIIKDCSEKTIQRELISMIKDNIVVRNGERRWSRYSISQS